MPTPNNALIQRLKHAMENKRINARELADRAAVGRSFVYDILRGKSSNPTTMKLSAIADVLGVNVSYLMPGGVFTHHTVFPDNNPRPHSTASILAIPTLTTQSIPGGGIVLADDAHSKPHFFRLDWIDSRLKTLPENLRIVYPSSDHMAPTLDVGDVVLINSAQKELIQGGMYAIFENQAIRIARLEPAAKKGCVKIIYDNTAYRPKECEFAEITLLGRVVWFAREL